MDETESGEDIQGEVPDGIGPEIFRERLRRAAAQDPTDGAVVEFEHDTVFLADIASVEEDAETRQSRIRLRNGLVIGSLTGAAIVAALATIRYRRHHPR